MLHDEVTACAIIAQLVEILIDFSAPGGRHSGPDIVARLGRLEFAARALGSPPGALGAIAGTRVLLDL